MLDDYLSAEEACQLAQISRRTLTNRLKAGDLAHEYRGRRLYICKSGLEALYRKRISEQSSKDFQFHGLEKMLSQILAELKEIKESNLEIARKVASLEHGNDIKGTKKNATNTLTKSQDSTKAGKQLETKLAISTNEQRAEEAKQRLFAALDAMSDMPMYRGKPSITGIHKVTGLDRGTISKYLSEYLALS